MYYLSPFFILVKSKLNHEMGENNSITINELLNQISVSTVIHTTSFKYYCIIAVLLILEADCAFQFRIKHLNFEQRICTQTTYYLFQLQIHEILTQYVCDLEIFYN